METHRPECLVGFARIRLGRHGSDDRVIVGIAFQCAQYGVIHDKPNCREPRIGNRLQRGDGLVGIVRQRIESCPLEADAQWCEAELCGVVEGLERVRVLARLA